MINPLQQAAVADAAATPGHGLNVAFDCKIRGAADDYARQGVSFISMASESFLGWHKTAVPRVKRHRPRHRHRHLPDKLVVMRVVVAARQPDSRAAGGAYVAAGV